MISPSKRSSKNVSQTGGSDQRLLKRVRQGSASAIEVLFTRYSPWVRRRVRGRLPQWARDGITTSDLAQDVLHHTFARLKWFESKHMGALRSYLRRAVENRVQDELRRATRRLDDSRVAPPQEPFRPTEEASPQHQQMLNKEMWKRYRDGLKGLKDRDRHLIVGRAELGYSYRQLAAIERMPSADAARKALKRAVIRLSKVMPKA
ncbi:MAG: RNA polymerase sigma factor [Acidobacteriota bacterium]|nr:RNA polymerase sigma factor [Acidobacteriota bacterium]